LPACRAFLGCSTRSNQQRIKEGGPQVISAITFWGVLLIAPSWCQSISPLPPFSLWGVSRLSVLLGPDPPIAAFVPLSSLQKSPEGAGQCYVSLAFPQIVRTSPRFHFPPLNRQGLAQPLATLLTANLTCCKPPPTLQTKACSRRKVFFSTPPKNPPQLLIFLSRVCSCSDFGAQIQGVATNLSRYCINLCLILRNPCSR
jgi:hypothetical protein